MSDSPASIWPLAAALLGALNLVLLVLLWLRQGSQADASRLDDRLDALAEGQARLLREQPAALEQTRHTERELREAVQGAARDTRLELAAQLADFQRLSLAQAAEGVRSQNEQIDTFRTQLATLQTTVVQALQAASATQVAQAQAAREAQDQALQRHAVQLTQQLQAQAEGSDRRLQELRAGSEQRLVAVQAAVDQRLAALQGAVETRLGALQADNEKKLEQMRATVDEKLHATLEQRLGESFKQVAERLEQVHRGLGEMQSLAQGVGDLKRVLGNVKTRGVFGEVQLGNLLEQVFAVDQYAVNVATRPGSAERVEFAIRLPGRGGEGAAPVWLPIDAKFPREDYERLLDAQERADREATELASRALEQRIRDEARSIRAKYVEPPHTTDFAILFVPTEGLFAELLRRPGLNEALMKEQQVTLAGPTTLLAMLNSLQMGFRTLAIEQRSSEVWTVLGAVKTEFGKFGDVLAKTKKKLQEAQNTIESAEVRTRAMDRRLRSVEALPEAGAQALLGAALGDGGEPADAGEAEGA